MDAKSESPAHHPACLRFFHLNNVRVRHSSKDKKLRERGAMGAICLQESGVKTTKPRCDAADSDPAGPRITSSHSSSDSEIDSRFEEASGGPTCYSRGNCDGDTRLRRRGRQWLDSAEGRKVRLTPANQLFAFLPKSSSLLSLSKDMEEYFQYMSVLLFGNWSELRERPSPLDNFCFMLKCRLLYAIWTIVHTENVVAAATSKPLMCGGCSA